MAETLILSRASAQRTIEPMLNSFHGRLIELVAPVEGFRTATIWKADASSDYAVISQYSSDEACEQGLERISRGSLMMDILDHLDGPPDVARLHLHGQAGLPLPNVQIGEYMSMSVRVADPGRGAELIQELQVIFGELSMIPGYLGSAIGHADSLSEEAVGIVFWSTREAFMESLPKKSLYDVRLYRRIL